MIHRAIPPAASRPPLVVAIPVRDEADAIGDCLRALATQQDGGGHSVVLLLNNCTDGTEAAVRAIAPGLPLDIHVVPCTLPPGQADAGHARRAAMEHAARLLPGHGLLLATDADGQVAPDWIAATCAAMRRGADAVAGRIQLDPRDAARIPAHLHADDARECAYGALLDEIDALLDPDPLDPWPRHAEHSGASIAVTLDAYRTAGGIPTVATGEDRAFFAALRRTDARIRHAPEVQVTVSGRLQGRAAGGMADTIRRRIQQQDPFLDDRLEPAAHQARRAAMRARCRDAWAVAAPGSALAAALALSRAELQAAFSLPYFGAAWARLEDCSPVLGREPVARVGLAHETAQALRLRDRLQRAPIGGGVAAPADTLVAAAAETA